MADSQAETNAITAAEVGAVVVDDGSEAAAALTRLMRHVGHEVRTIALGAVADAEGTEQTVAVDALESVATLRDLLRPIARQAARLAHCQLVALPITAAADLLKRTPAHVLFSDLHHELAADLAPGSEGLQFAAPFVNMAQDDIARVAPATAAEAVEEAAAKAEFAKKPRVRAAS